MVFGLLFLLFCPFFSKAQQNLSPEAKKIQNYMVDHAVIAHRGTTYWAPELTEAAFRWARNTGADYLELDVHRSKDGVLIIHHDKNFARTTDVAVKFPGREKDPVSSFTFEEILLLDAGSAFNRKNPEQARESFSKCEVPVFEDVFRIAEGKRIKRNTDGSRVYKKDTSTNRYIFEYEPDPADNGHRPGIYIETKDPENYPGIEEEIYTELSRMGWNVTEEETLTGKEPAYSYGKVNIGNTQGKILLQTFSREGMRNLQRVFRGKVLMSFLVGNPVSDIFSQAETQQEMIDFALTAGAQFIGTNIGNRNDGLRPDFAQKIHTAGLRTNVYSFNQVREMEKYELLTDGMITNRTDLNLDFYQEKGWRKYKRTQSPQEIIETIGY